MTKSLTHIPDTIFRLGLAANTAFHARKDFSLSLAFPSYASALAFRKLFYSSRSFLRTLQQRKPQDALRFTDAISGLERLSCARLDKAPAQAQLTALGSIYLDFTMKTNDASLDQQLDALGLPALDLAYNPDTTTNADFMAAHMPSAPAAFTSPQQMYKPAAAPSPAIELPIADPNALPTAFFIFDYNCTPQDFMARSAHETALKLQAAIDAFINQPNTITLANLRRLRRKLLDSQVSEDLRQHIMQSPELDGMLATEF
jgi:hypothetical protein